MNWWCSNGFSKYTWSQKTKDAKNYTATIVVRQTLGLQPSVLGLQTQEEEHNKWRQVPVLGSPATGSGIS